jgi:hypothetical protein
MLLRRNAGLRLGSTFCKFGAGRVRCLRFAFRLFRLRWAFSALGWIGAFATSAALTTLTPLTATTAAAAAAAATGFARTFRALLFLRSGFCTWLSFGLRLWPRRTRLTWFTRRAIAAFRPSFTFRTRFAFRASFPLRALAAAAILARLALLRPVHFALPRPAVTSAAFLPIATAATATTPTIIASPPVPALTRWFAPGRFTARRANAAASLCFRLRRVTFQPTHNAGNDAWLRLRFRFDRFRHRHRCGFARRNALHGGLRPRRFRLHARQRFGLFLSRHLYHVVAGGQRLSLIQIIVA